MGHPNHLAGVFLVAQAIFGKQSTPQPDELVHVRNPFANAEALRREKLKQRQSLIAPENCRTLLVCQTPPQQLVVLIAKKRRYLQYRNSGATALVDVNDADDKVDGRSGTYDATRQPYVSAFAGWLTR